MGTHLKYLFQNNNWFWEMLDMLHRSPSGW